MGKTRSRVLELKYLGKTRKPELDKGNDRVFDFLPRWVSHPLFNESHAKEILGGKLEFVLDRLVNLIGKLKLYSITHHQLFTITPHQLFTMKVSKPLNR